MNSHLEHGGSAPTPPRFIALVSGKAYAQTKRKRRCCAAFPQTRQGAQVASQRCPILPAGKATSLYHGEMTLKFTPPKMSLTWGTHHYIISSTNTEQQLKMRKTREENQYGYKQTTGKR